MSSFNSQLSTIQEAKEDFEWYPTANEQIECLKNCLKADLDKARNYRDSYESFLDIGAGNGKVLDAIKESKLALDFYYIEKSTFHRANLDPSYYLLGVDFWNTTFIDKEVSVIFCNPPYSEYEEWTKKIIKECPLGTQVYLIIPERWVNSKIITETLQQCNQEFEIRGSFSFEAAEDRKARAKVNLVSFFTKKGYSDDDNDPFYRFFNETFSYSKPKQEKPFEEELKEKVVTRKNLIEALCEMYDLRMEELHKNYKIICQLDADPLKEFEISRHGLLESLKMKLTNTKKQYWQRLFDGMDNINKLLTSDSRKKINSLMQANTGVDFNIENAYEIVLWVIRNANQYFDPQFIETYEQLMEYANVENYVSNQRVFKKNGFHYRAWRHWGEERPTHVCLKVGHRIVLEHCGGLHKSPYGFTYGNGLSERAAEFIGDIMCIAHNLGFLPTEKCPREGEWNDSKARDYYCKNNGKEELLFTVRAFYNGNMHFQFNPSFVHAMNIQFGRLKGWLNNEDEVEQEIKAPKDLTNKFFNHTFRLQENQLMLK